MASVGERIPNIISSRPVYNATTQHLYRTEVGFYEILTRSNNFNQFRDLMMEFLANRPSVEQYNDIRGTGRKYVKDTSAHDFSGFGPHHMKEIEDLEDKEEEFDYNLGSIPYFDNIETVTKSFPRNFQRPYTYEKELLKTDTKQPDLFEGLQIHSQSKGGKKTRKTRKSRK